jgi:hypothetical protein
MVPAPEEIGGARVILYAPVDDRCRPTGKCKHVVWGKVAGPAAGLAICRYAGEDAFYLFGCDEDWASVTDSWFRSLEEAIRQAEVEYEGISKLWITRAGD